MTSNTPMHHILRERLRQEISRKGLSAVELARRAGVKNSFIYDILNGKSMNPSTVRLAQVAEALGVNLAYLAGASESPDSGGAPTPADCIQVRLLEASEEEGNTLETYCWFRKSWIQNTLKTAPHQVRLMRVPGDAMAPTLFTGDLVLVDTQRNTPSPAGIFALHDGGGLAIKRLELAGNNTVRVLSDNPKYGAFERPLSQLRILGRIVWFAREM